MPTFFLDGEPVEFEPGQDILTAALKVDQFIPHYCYHPAMSRVATCRMCMVEVEDDGRGRKMPKLQTSCSTQAMENMKVVTKNDRVKRARESVMEFLLINHPLDCPICDQAGECSLQDYSFNFGTGKSIVSHEKRIYGLRDIGSFLQLERNRCIHCTRCVRFTQEITGTHEMGVYGRTHQLTVDTFVDYPLSDQFQGNLADICPVGAITMKDFRFKKRVWHLKKAASICTGCSTGCNVWLHHHDGQIHRVTPRENQQLNKWWMCDFGRISFHEYMKKENRVLNPLISGEKSNWKKALDSFDHAFNQSDSSADQVVVLASSSSTCEELFALKRVVSNISNNVKLLFTSQPKDDAEFDQTFKTFISKDKKPNQNGVRKLGFQEIGKEPSGIEWSNVKLLMVLGEEHDKWFELQTAIQKAEMSVFISCLKSKYTNEFNLVLPTLSPLEKEGFYINRTGVLQKLRVSIAKPFSAKSELLILEDLEKATKLSQSAYPSTTEIRKEMAQSDVFYAPMTVSSEALVPKIPSQCY